MSLTIVPITLRDAKAFVKKYHRHNKPPIGHKFSIAVQNSGTIVGVAIAGRPVARALDDGLTLEVIRTCTDGHPNANSMLYGAIWKAAKAMGYRKCLTYTQVEETGASLRAVGWVRSKELPARAGWHCESRPRMELGTEWVERVRWEIEAK